MRSSAAGSPSRAESRGLRNNRAQTRAETPDVMWTDNGLPDFHAGSSADVAFESAMNSQLDSILNGDKLCRQH